MTICRQSTVCHNKVVYIYIYKYSRKFVIVKGWLLMYRCFLATHLPIAKVLQRFEVELVPPDIRNHKFEFSYSELEKKKIRFVYSSTNQSWNKLRGNMPDSRRFKSAFCLSRAQGRDTHSCPWFHTCSELQVAVMDQKHKNAPAETEKKEQKLSFENVLRKRLLNLEVKHK